MGMFENDWHDPGVVLKREGEMRRQIEQLRSRLTTAEKSVENLGKQAREQKTEIERLQQALDRYRYAVVYAAAEAWDGGLDMRARFGWARALDGKVMTDDEVAAIGKQYHDWEGGVGTRT